MMKLLKALLAALGMMSGLWAAPSGPVSAHETEFDLVITGALVLRGDGSTPFLAEIGIKDGRIAEVGRIRVPEGVPILRARGRYVCPGFIDIHTHAEDGLIEFPQAENYLLQGVTTVVGGNCGASHFPLSALFRRLEGKGTAVNFASLTGHNTIRAIVMGRKTATPSPRELRRMLAMVDQEMRAGAAGLSAGLTYFPGRHSTMRELIELAGAVQIHNGLFAVHMRSEGRRITHALEEAVHVGEKTGVRIQISHLKLSDESVWDRVHLITDRMDYAVARGVEIHADVYPYTASSTGYSTWFPPWSRPVLRGRSKSSAAYVRLKQRLTRSFGDNLDRYYVGTYRPDPGFEGRSFSELLSVLGREPTSEAAAELLIDIQRRGQAQGIFFFMREEDVRCLMRQPFTMIASDGVVAEFGQGKPHPRSYGTFPRVLARYVRDTGTLALPDAVRKMTSLPARALRLGDRGLIEPGYWADLVVFDLTLIKDAATYADPHRHPGGIAYVLVNGRITAAFGRPTGARPGRVLRLGSFR